MKYVVISGVLIILFNVFWYWLNHMSEPPTNPHDF